MIKLDEKYRIEKYPNGYKLVYETSSIKTIKGETKEVSTVDRWYYSSVKQCMKKYVNEFIGDSNSIKDLIDRLEKIEERLEVENVNF